MATVALLEQNQLESLDLTNRLMAVTLLARNDDGILGQLATPVETAA